MYCIKNLSIGVSQGALLNLFWIFEYVTSGPFAGPLSVDFTDVQKVTQRFLAICILNFNPQNKHRGVKIYSPENNFFLSWSISFRLMADRVIFDIGWVVDKACI